jgi:nitrous oxidase accessory protein NosD
LLLGAGIGNSFASQTLPFREDSSLPSILYVDDDNIKGPWLGTRECPYHSIEQAVDAATEETTIYVFDGYYPEVIIIDKPIFLKGETRDSVIINGDYHPYIIEIMSDNVILDNLTIKNSGGSSKDAGVHVLAANVTLQHCQIYRTKTAVACEGTSFTLIDNCSFYTNGEGICLDRTDHCTIKDTQCCHNGIGIHVIEAKDTRIEHSYTHTNGIGILFQQTTTANISHCMICDNNDNQGGIYLEDCIDITLTQTMIHHNGMGINIDNTSRVAIHHCDIRWNTHYTVDLKDHSHDVIISFCEIAQNFRYGIYSKESELTLTSNNMYENHLYGLYAQTTTCDARNNWWGYPLGPSPIQLGPADRVSIKPGSLLYMPFAHEYIQNAGLTGEPPEPFTPITISDDMHPDPLCDGTDTDGDGCPDWWENKWNYNPNTWDDHKSLDPDGDGLTNIQECFTDQWNSNPYSKDLFIECDWMETKTPGSTNKPNPSLLTQMIERFKDHNITLHVDDGSLGGGEEVPYVARFSYDTLRDFYWMYFLHDDMNNPRKEIFHYCFICDYGPGSGFAFMGWDHLDSFCICAQSLKEGLPYNRDRIIVSVIMHETGHTLGLFVDDFMGNDNRGTLDPFCVDFWLYSTYKSCMNYLYTYHILDYSDGSHGPRDFNDWGTLDFRFFRNTHFEWPKTGVNPLSTS